jgi:catechol 2,3-dioxygenase-like lactoylglutathione lyase family enzyme
MELFGIRLLVGDLAAAVRFWRDLMKFSLQFQDESLGYAYFDTGKVGLELLTRDEFAAAIGEITPVATPQGRQVVVDIRVDDVDTAYAELIAQGATSVSTPKDRPVWRARAAHIADPDGHIVELYTSLPDSALPTA